MQGQAGEVPEEEEDEEAWWWVVDYFGDGTPELQQRPTFHCPRSGKLSQLPRPPAPGMVRVPN